MSRRLGTEVPDKIVFLLSSTYLAIIGDPRGVRVPEQLIVVEAPYPFEDEIRTVASGSSRIPRELKHITIGSKRNQLGGRE